MTAELNRAPNAFLGLVVGVGVVTPLSTACGVIGGTITGAIAGAIVAAPIGAAAVVGLVFSGTTAAVSSLSSTIFNTFLNVCGVAGDSCLRFFGKIAAIVLGVVSGVAAVSGLVSVSGAALGLTTAIALDVLVTSFLISAIFCSAIIVVGFGTGAVLGLGALGIYSVYRISQ